MIIAIASGKGGTGKTTVAVNLALEFGAEVLLLDCDVEEPNCHLFLRGIKTGEAIVTVPIPQIDELKCDACGECGRFCEYHAIAAFGSLPLIFSELCHGCGGCAKVCPKHAISEVDKRLGLIQTIQAGNITLIEGRLDVGVATAPPVIRAVKSRLDHSRSAILDAPPGTSCPVTTTLRGADVVALVTESTPFGLYDLKLAVAVVRELNLPFGVVINRVGIGDARVQSFCRTERIPILSEIPEDRRIAVAYSRGIPIVEALPESRTAFRRLLDRIMSLRSEKED